MTLLRFALCFLFLFSLSYAKVAGPEAQVYRIAVPQPSVQLIEVATFYDVLLKEDFDVWSVDLLSGRLDVAVYSILEDSRLRSLSHLYLSAFDTEVLYASLSSAIEHSLAENAAKRAQSDIGFFEAYRTVDEIHQYLDDLQAAHPTLAKVVNVGFSYEGRPIQGIQISTNISSDTPSTKANIVYIGCQHAREWVSPMTVTYLANQLCSTYDVESASTTMLQNFQYTLIPIVNPDGYNYSWVDDRMWRKNRRDNEGSACYGVDLNRNWAYEWGTGGSSPLACSDTYMGESPFSEPETTAVSNYMLSLTAPTWGYIDFHAYGQYFFNPWGYTTAAPPDNKTQIALAQDFVAAVKSVHGKVYTIGNSADVLYIASGGSDDWAYGSMGIVYSYTAELRDTGRFGFLLPPEEIIPTGQEIWAGVQEMASFLLSYGPYNDVYSK